MMFKRDGLGIFLKQIAALISEPILVPQTAADQPSQLTPIFKLDFGDNDFEMSPFFFPTENMVNGNNKTAEPNISV